MFVLSLAGMKLRVEVCLLVALVGCGGTTTEQGSADASVIRGDSVAQIDGSVDASTTRTDSVVEGDGGDVAPTPCPDMYPGDGNTCVGFGKCEFKDSDCGGTLTAACVGNRWETVTKPKCGPSCPSRIPEAGAACATYPDGQVCAFWPVSPDTCTSCVCSGGSWKCADSVSCPFTRPTCQPGTACSANTGCGAGKCQFFCGCGVDFVLHCSAHPC